MRVRDILSDHRWIRRPSVLGALHMLLLACFIIIAYVPSMDGEFAFDDLQNIVTNPHVHPQSFGEITRALDSDASATRPLAMLSFAFNYWLGAYDPFGYHVFNLALHLLNAAVLYLICINLLEVASTGRNAALPDAERKIRLRQLAFWGVLLWAVHPVQTQAVTYVVQRMTLLAALFHFFSILAFIYYKRGRMGAPAAIFVISTYFALGMLSKEIMVVMPLSLLTVNYIFFEDMKPVRAWQVTAAVLLVAAAGLFYLGGHLPAFLQPYPDRNFSPFERLLTEPRVLMHYLSLYAFPYIDRLHVDYVIAPSRSLVEPLTTLFSMLGLGMLTGAALALRRRLPMLAFAVLFFFLASSVEASFLNLELAFVHRLYIPSAFLFVAVLAELPVPVFRRATLVLGALMLALVYTTMMRNHEWQTNARLWEADLARGASPERTTINLAIGLLDTGHVSEAVAAINRVLGANSELGSMRLYVLRGYAYFLAGDTAKCIEANEEILHRFGWIDKALFYGGLCLLEENRHAEVLADISRLRQRFPLLPYAGILNAEYARRIGHPEIAEAMLLDAVDVSPPQLADFRNIARLYLANLYLDQKRFDDAYALYRAVVRNDPKNWFSWKQIYRMQVSAGDTANAETIRRFLESQNVDVSDP